MKKGDTINFLGKMATNYDENLGRFIAGATLMINTTQNYGVGGETIYGTRLHVDSVKRFDLVRGNVTNLQYPRGYTFARIERDTGDIYSQCGQKVRGSIYSEESGLDSVDRYGVIVRKY